MTTLKDSAMAYEPKTTKTIDEAGNISLDFPTAERSKKNKDGQEYSYTVALINGEEYRVPDSVKSDIKDLLEAKPSLKTIRVTKKGQGMSTQYTVVPID